jgi:hypothetical protein
MQLSLSLLPCGHTYGRCLDLSTTRGVSRPAPCGRLSRPPLAVALALVGHTSASFPPGRSPPRVASFLSTLFVLIHCFSPLLQPLPLRSASRLPIPQPTILRAETPPRSLWTETSKAVTCSNALAFFIVPLVAKGSYPLALEGEALSGTDSRLILDELGGTFEVPLFLPSPPFSGCDCLGVIPLVFLGVVSVQGAFFFAFLSLLDRPHLVTEGGGGREHHPNRFVSP